MTDFHQDGPVLTNSFDSHRWLKAYLQFKLPSEMMAHIEGDLHRFGQLCVELMPAARAAEREKPVHIPFDPWGRRIDEIRVSTAWTRMHEISAREGLIANGYRRAYGEFSRLYQFAKLFLFHPSSAFYTCPLAMADGAARVLEIHGKTEGQRQAFSHLTTDSPQEFWTSGQWMTEKTGGSDVGLTSTEAREEDGQMRLYGTKWFSSATTSEIALALARLPGAPEGSRGLSLFMVPLREAGGGLNRIRVLRLKDKLGTSALPTAELQLEGARAELVGPAGQGVKTVATMLNVTRLYNSVCSAGQMARALAQLDDYAKRRQVFGKRLSDQVLHFDTFAIEHLKALASMLLTFECAHLIGRDECGTASPEDVALLRLLTPVTKLFTAKAAVGVASEVIEGFGGAGYIEDTGVAVHLRDSQVFSIWEGATNVLSLDLLRVIKDPQPLAAFAAAVRTRMGAIKNARIKNWAEEASGTLKTLVAELAKLERAAEDVRVASSRPLAFYLARFYAYVLLLEWADAHPDRLLPWIEVYRSEFLNDWQIKDARILELARRMGQDSDA